jgi:hypothetical protein
VREARFRAVHPLVADWWWTRGPTPIKQQIKESLLFIRQLLMIIRRLWITWWAREEKVEATGTLAKVCKCCGAPDASLACGICLTVYYCCQQCILRNWKEGGENRHKFLCKKMIEIRARYVEKAKREIEEQMAKFRVSSSSAGNSQGEAGPIDNARGWDMKI